MNQSEPSENLSKDLNEEYQITPNQTQVGYLFQFIGGTKLEQ